MMALVSFFVSLTTDNRNRCLNVKKPRFSWDFFFRLSDKTRKETDPWFAIDPGFSVLIPYEPRKGRFLPFLCSSIGQTTLANRRLAAQNQAIYKVFSFFLSDK